MKDEVSIIIKDFQIIKFFDDFQRCLELIRTISKKLNFNKKAYIEYFCSRKELSNYLNINIPNWSYALSFSNFILIVDYNKWKAKSTVTFDQTIIHEFSHVVINEITKGKCPLWLNEGLAQYYSGEYKKVLNKKYNVDKTCIYEPSYKTTDLYYISAKLVYYIIMKYGENTILDKIKNVESFNKDSILGEKNINLQLNYMLKEKVL